MWRKLGPRPLGSLRLSSEVQAPPPLAVFGTVPGPLGIAGQAKDLNRFVSRLTCRCRHQNNVTPHSSISPGFIVLVHDLLSSSCGVGPHP